ncbi:hypothetical protein TTHERM_00318640 (macronuclear) [Tetrahymena thermophila SB210]|uniref:Uncharacterized protein n=1 Tax=Tetrahymena thermophila (strain SB210) TaxID=312017 RepID=I7ML55_TETTS|nr:hypothetical protein TTHERM_00318640 [Tetrahymena thermophila SB210]EAS01201.3 hypothetical protein TTHERM_00318640 [Tetrahymena thermophila SB210]|eukprot:XP_001021446.3 hypothetical protein TTHERM_00318640 [Tetrahymena thermophila SB210]
MIEQKQKYLDFCTENNISIWQQHISIIDKNSSLVLIQSNEDSEKLDHLILGTSFILSCNLKNFLQLQIRNQNLSTDHISTLIWGLGQNNFFQELILTNCMIDDQGAIALSLWLKENQSLNELDISYNKITDFGAELLFKSIQNHKGIQTINIKNNQIEKDFIANELLTHNNQIEVIDISENPYTLQSVESLLRGLIQSDKIKRLRMSGIKIGQIHKLFILEVLEKCRALQELAIDIEIQNDELSTVQKFEEALIFNCDILNLESSKLDISENELLTKKMFYCLRANQLLAVNSQLGLNNVQQEIEHSQNVSGLLKEIIAQKIEIIKQNRNVVQYTEDIIQESRFYKISENDQLNFNDIKSNSMENFCKKSLASKPTNISTCPQTQTNGNFLLSQSNYSPTNINSESFIYGIQQQQTIENDTNKFSVNNFSNTMMEDNRTYPTFQTMKSNEKISNEMYQVNQILNNRGFSQQQLNQCQGNIRQSELSLIENEIIQKIENAVYQKIKSNIELEYNNQFNYIFQEMQRQDQQIKSLYEDFNSLKKDFIDSKSSIRHSKNVLKTGDNLIPTRGFSEIESYQNIENVDASNIYKIEDPFAYQSEIDDIKVLQKIQDFQKKMQQTKQSIQKSRRSFSREKLRERGSIQDLSTSINNSINLNNNSSQNKSFLYDNSNIITQNNKSSQRYQNSNNNLNHSISRRDSNSAILIDYQGSGSTSLKSSHLASQQEQNIYQDNSQLTAKDGVLKIKDLNCSHNSQMNLNQKQPQFNKISQSRSQSNKENSISGYSCLNTSASYRKNSSISNSRNNLYQKSFHNQHPSDELIEELRRRGIYIN